MVLLHRFGESMRRRERDQLIGVTASQASIASPTGRDGGADSRPSNVPFISTSLSRPSAIDNVTGRIRPVQQDVRFVA
jgi:hypothetical protein